MSKEELRNMIDVSTKLGKQGDAKQHVARFIMEEGDKFFVCVRDLKIPVTFPIVHNMAEGTLCGQPFSAWNTSSFDDGHPGFLIIEFRFDYQSGSQKWYFKRSE